ncbi:HEAT repeat domain-containing protein, partial [Bacteroidota bacterium]
HSQETNLSKIKQEIAEKGIKKFIKEIDKAPNEEKIISIKLLGEVKDPGSVKPIINKFLMDESENEQVKSTAVFALGEINDRSASMPLVKLFDLTSNVTIRLQIAVALKKLEPHSEDVEQAGSFFTDEDWWVRDQIELIKIGDPIVKDLYFLFGKSWKLDEVLGKIGTFKAIKFMIFRSQPNGYSWPGNENKYLKIGEPAVKPLIEYLKDSESFFADPDFENFKKPRIDKNRRTEFRSRSEEEKKLGITTFFESYQFNIRGLLKEIEYHPENFEDSVNYFIAIEDWEKLILMDKTAVDPLISALHHEVSSTREGVIKTLGKIQDPRSIEPLIIVLLTSENATERNLAEQALVSLKCEKVIEHLIIAAQEDWPKNTQAVKVLLEMQVTDPEAIKLYIQTLSIDNDDLSIDNDDLKLKAANIIVSSQDQIAIKARPQALEVIANLTCIVAIVNYDSYGRENSLILKNTKGQEVAKKDFYFNASNPTQKMGEAITDLVKGNIIHNEVYDAYGRSNNPMWLCLDIEGNIIRNSGKAVFVKTFGAVQKSKFEIEYNSRGFKDKKIIKIYPCKNCVEKTGMKNCKYVW